jgi:cell wall-associated NlpC family hydrolase
MNVIVGEPHLAYEFSRPEHPYRILPGSSLPFYRPDNQTFSLGQKTLRLDSQPQLHTSPATGDDLIAAAMRFIHTPYLWGGRSLFGTDAGGLIQIVLKICRIRSSREITHQVNSGVALHFLEEAIPGDLLFFGEEGAEVSHAGIYTASGQLIHAFGKVRMDRVDHHGIFNQTTIKYTHHLRTIIRIPGIAGGDVKE